MTPPHPPTILGWSSGGGLEYLSRPRYRPPTPMVIKEIPLKIFRNKKISREISCKKFKNHLQFYMKILLKKISSFFTGKSLVKFFQNHTLENIFQKLSPRGCFWKFSKISPTCPKFNTHKKIVVHFFIPMLLLPLTPPSTYLKIKKIKGPKVDHFITHFITSSLHHFTSS